MATVICARCRSASPASSARYPVGMTACRCKPTAQLKNCAMDPNAVLLMTMRHQPGANLPGARTLSQPTAPWRAAHKP